MKGGLSGTEQTMLNTIENERLRLLRLDTPLNDGTLATPASLDRGISIATACRASKPPNPALMLFQMIRELNPKTVLELGTNVGISSAYILAALAQNGIGGTLTTLDVSPYRLRLAKEFHERLALQNIVYVEGLFEDTLQVQLSGIDSVDLAFIDGHHQYQPTLDYFAQIFEKSSANAVFVFDHIRCSPGMRKAWMALQADERLGMVVDLWSVGIGVRRHDTIPDRYVFPPIYNAIRH